MRIPQHRIALFTIGAAIAATALAACGSQNSVNTKDVPSTPAGTSAPVASSSSSGGGGYGY